MLPWGVDRELDEAIVGRVIREQFPRVKAEKVVRVGSGWDNDVYRVDRIWAFRFPRRAEVVSGLRSECAMLEYLAPLLCVQVPVAVSRGVPCDGFPYPFVGYRWLEGKGGDCAVFDKGARSALAGALGNILSVLHGLDTSLLPVVLPHARGVGQRVAAMRRRFSELVELLGERQANLWAKRWWREAELPVYQGGARYLHNDIGSEHLLFNDRTRVVGLIDFTDQALGDPVLDLIGLYTWFGPDFVREMVAHIASWAFSERDMQRLRFYVAWATTEWGLDTAKEGDPEATLQYVAQWRSKIWPMLGYAGVTG